MPKKWKIVVGTIIIVALSVIGYGIYSWANGQQELWHDTGSVAWISQQYFVTQFGAFGSHFSENFTIRTNYHGNITFTTDANCSVPSGYHCPYSYAPVGRPKVGQLAGLIRHRDGSTEIILSNDTVIH